MIRCQPALGTFVEIEACHPEEVLASEHDSALSFAIDQAFAAIQTAQNCMSVFDLNSDLSQINAGNFLNRTGVIHPWLWDVLQLAKQIHALSPDFDPSATIYLIHQGMRPNLDQPTAAVLGGLVDVILLEDHSVVTKKPVYIDLGGIAKGAAVDRAIDALQTHGVVSGSVNAGGDLRVFGAKAHSIHLRHPSAPQSTFYAGKLQDGALATSGDYFVSQGGDPQQKNGHLISPKHNLPIQTEKSFSVIAPICAVADALTKVFAITGDAHHPALRHFDAQAIEVTA
jgi:thiamine biosynthesis lipoprotein